MPSEKPLNVTWVRPPECPVGEHDAKWSRGLNGVWMVRCDKCLVVATIDEKLAERVLNTP
jgi:hypothetical protein